MADSPDSLENNDDMSDLSDLSELKVLVSEDLARAWQRCTWIITHETGRTKTDIMAEMIRDFLVKHGC